MSQEIKPICLCFSSRGYICTLPKCHAGPHVADGPGGGIIAVWPSDRQLASVLQPTSLPDAALLGDKNDDSTPRRSGGASLN